MTPAERAEIVARHAEWETWQPTPFLQHASICTSQYDEQYRGQASRTLAARQDIADLLQENERLTQRFDFLAHLHHQRAFSERTFGPGERTAGVLDHIRKELREIEQEPSDLSEWIDVVILALDGAWRIGASPEEIIAALVAKQAKNEARTWPDWKTAEPGKAIEHLDEAALEREGGGS
jgi:hypothetical protein